MNRDLTELLAPLPGDAPCGADLSFSSEFDSLREMRREDDPTLDQGEWVTELKRADWPGVRGLCEQLLRERSKDLRIAGWWTEAASRIDGFDGLADGLALYAGLLRQHGDAVHPLPEGGDHELRIGSIVWLLSLVPERIRLVPLLEDAELRLSQADIELARQRAAGSDERPNADDLARAQRKTPAKHVARRLAALRRVPQALADLQAEVDARLGADGPGFVATREAVQAAVAFVERLARDMGVIGDANGKAEATKAGNATPAPGAPQPTHAAGELASRAQALAQLRQVAEYFRRTEPHSPVAYLAERAASWGEMPLHLWLRTVMKEGAGLAQLEELLGVPPGSADAA